MIQNDSPIFANTCGKLFKDTVVFASPSKETVLPVNTIKKIAFRKGVTTGSLLFMALPFGFFALADYLDEGVFLSALLYIVGLITLVTAVFKADMRYSIHIFMTDNTSRKINVWKGNKKDASKFVTESMKLIDAYKVKLAMKSTMEVQGVFRIAQ